MMEVKFQHPSLKNQSRRPGLPLLSQCVVYCHGLGAAPRKPCSVCHGEGACCDPCTISQIPQVGVLSERNPNAFGLW